MPGLVTALPSRRPELIVRPLGDCGRYVIKDPYTGSFFHIGEQEYYLLMQLDGARDAEEVCGAFAERFGEPLAHEDLDGFIQLVKEGVSRSRPQ